MKFLYVNIQYLLYVPVDVCFHGLSLRVGSLCFITGDLRRRSSQSNGYASQRVLILYIPSIERERSCYWAIRRGLTSVKRLTKLWSLKRLGGYKNWYKGGILAKSASTLSISHHHDHSYLRSFPHLSWCKGGLCLQLIRSRCSYEP